jgi:ketosteroid isomerase-like protein
MSQENVEIVRRVFAVFNHGDVGELADLVSPDWVMDWSQSIGPLQGTFAGLAGAASWMDAIKQTFDEFAITATEYIGSGERIVVRARVTGTGRGSGVAVEAGGTTLWEVEEGRVVRMTLYQNDAEALEAAGLSE